jgi:hypothetical protein
MNPMNPINPINPMNPTNPMNPINPMNPTNKTNATCSRALVCYLGFPLTQLHRDWILPDKVLDEA